MPGNRAFALRATRESTLLRQRDIPWSLGELARTQTRAPAQQRREGEPMCFVVSLPSGTPRSRSNHTVTNRVANQTCGVMDVQFPHEARTVEIGGLGTNVQGPGDLLGGHSPGHEKQNLTL